MAAIWVAGIILPQRSAGGVGSAGNSNGDSNSNSDMGAHGAWKVDTPRARGLFVGGLGVNRMREKEIEAKLRAGVKALGGLCLKWESPGYTGVPDRMILLPGGRILFVELKAPGKKERPRQVVVQQILTRLGFTVFPSVDSLDKVRAIIDQCREAITHGQGV